MRTQSEPGVNSHKTSTVLESYSFFVVEELIGIKGTNISDVVNYVVKDWISEHTDELREYGISVKEWRSKRKLGESK